MTQLSFEDWESRPEKKKASPEQPPSTASDEAPTEGDARVFLGWESSPLAAAADWLFEKHGPDQSDLIIALPGANSVAEVRSPDCVIATS